MPKYLFMGSYTKDGVQGLLKDGGTKRRQVAQRAVESVGGRLETYYFTFGDTDFVGIVDVPDHVSIAALSLAVGSAGGSNFRTTVLLTPDEMDQAARKEISFTAPGR
jgi:uncharacterized protein with GYD domain